MTALTLLKDIYLLWWFSMGSLLTKITKEQYDIMYYSTRYYMFGIMLVIINFFLISKNSLIFLISLIVDITSIIYISLPFTKRNLFTISMVILLEINIFTISYFNENITNYFYFHIVFQHFIHPILFWKFIISPKKYMKDINVNFHLHIHDYNLEENIEDSPVVPSQNIQNPMAVSQQPPVVQNSPLVIRNSPPVMENSPSVV